MIYPSDFTYYSHKSKFMKNIKRISTIGLDDPHKNIEKEIQPKKVYHSDLVVSDEPIWIRYLNNSTVHGFRYLTDPTIRGTER